MTKLTPWLRHRADEAIAKLNAGEPSSAVRADAERVMAELATVASNEQAMKAFTAARRFPVIELGGER